MERPYKVLIVTDGHLSKKHFIDILPTLLYARQGGIPAPSRYRGFLLPLAEELRFSCRVSCRVCVSIP